MVIICDHPIAHRQINENQQTNPTLFLIGCNRLVN